MHTHTYTYAALACCLSSFAHRSYAACLKDNVRRTQMKSQYLPSSWARCSTWHCKGSSHTPATPFHVFPCVAAGTSWRMRNVPVRLHAVRLFIIQPVCNSCSPAAHKFFSPWNRQCTSDILSTRIHVYKGCVERQYLAKNHKLICVCQIGNKHRCAKACARLLLTTTVYIVCICTCLYVMYTYVCMPYFIWY